MRKLSESFMNDLVNRDGVLHPILERVKGDATLMLAIREDYINIYYRGGNILRIKEKGKHSYSSSFDNNYDKSGEKLPALPANIQDQDDARTWVNAFPLLKEIMDIWFFDNPKLEREFQQLVARENDYAPTSKNHKYFVSDIEFADTSLGARFDISAIRWLTSPARKAATAEQP
ncbi:MAG: hypothetical protein QGI29_05605 [Pirellulales bacterium]|nr:hypothetical protein [Pirellulales bacterium]